MQYPGKGIWIEGQWWKKEKILALDESETLAMNFHDKDIIPFLKSWFDTSRVFIGYTSGSTGAPKTVQLDKKYCWASARSTLEYFAVSPGGRALLSMPTKYIAGRMMIIRAIAGELDLKITAPSSNPELPDANFSLTAFTPHQFKSIVYHPGKERKNAIQVVLLGGAPVSPELTQQIYELGFNGKVFETFGMTETYSHIAIRSLYPVKTDYFEAVPDVSFATEGGQLVIRAPHIGIGYLKTNDIVELLSDQKFKWIGRADFVVNSGGIKLFPEKIEKKLSGFISEIFFVYGVPDHVLGERLILVVERGSNHEENGILVKANEFLDKFEKPKEIFFVERMYYTESGKINRYQTLLKNRYFT